MAITTTSAFDAPVNVVLQRDFLSNAKAHCPYYVGSEPASIREHSGSFTAKWLSVTNRTPTTSALSELTGSLTLPTRAGTASAKSEKTATVQKYGDVEYLTEEVDLLYPRNLEQKLMEVHSIQAGRSLNRLQRNELEDNLTLHRVGGAQNNAAVAGPIDANAIRYVVNQLDRSDAMKFTAVSGGSQNFNTSPIPACYWAMGHHDVMEDVRRIEGFIPVEKYAGHIRTAPEEVGTAGRLRFIGTSEATVDADSGGAPGGDLRSTTGASCDIYTTVVIGKECHGSVGLGFEHVQEQYKAGDDLPGIQMIHKAKGKLGGDPLDEIASFAWKTWHAAEILQTTWGYGIVSGARKLN